MATTDLESRECPNCEALVSEEWSYCPYCGYMLFW